MATFSTHARNNAAVQAFQWHITDGEQLPYVKFFVDGNYYYFDNQNGGFFPINDGDWVIQVGSGPSARFVTMNDSEFTLNFN